MRRETERWLARQHRAHEQLAKAQALLAAIDAGTLAVPVDVVLAATARVRRIRADLEDLDRTIPTELAL